MLNLKPQSDGYSGYSFARNPFPFVGVPGSEKVVFSNRERELRMIEEGLRGPLAGNSSHMVLVGGYGNGKTATLRYIQDQVTEQLPDALAIYVPTCGNSFLDTYRNMVLEFGLRRFEELSWAYLERSSSIENLKKKASSGETLVSDAIEKAKEGLLSEVSNIDFATAFLRLIFDETSLLAWKYLCGEPLPSEERRQIGVVSLIDTDEKALRALLSLKKILAVLGRKVLYIFIDELEAIEALYPVQKQRVLNGIRRLIDSCPQGLCVILACAPEVWSDVVREYHAFSERISREIVLRPLDTESITKVVSIYISRVSDGTAARRSPIYPFDREALDLVLKTAKGNLRGVLMICNQAVERGAENGFPNITAAFLKRTLPDLFPA